MLTRLHAEQPASFAFTEANLKWAEAQMTKYPEGRQASAIIPLLWRAQEQDGWLSRPAIEAVADMLGMSHIRALEVATFYFMFQLQPVGSVAHIQICGTLSCMICGAEDLVAVCKEKIADKPHQVSSDGKFSWEEVECLGACANAPMAQIGKDYYEDLTSEKLGGLIDAMARGDVPVPGPQNGRFAAEPLSGLTSLTEHESGRTQYNGSAQRAVDIGDSIRRIDGTEVPLLTPWNSASGSVSAGISAKPIAAESDTKEGAVAEKTQTGDAPEEAQTTVSSVGNDKDAPTDAANKASLLADVSDDDKPDFLSAPRKGGPDDLRQIKGVGPRIQGFMNELGIYHFDQLANFTDREVAWLDAKIRAFRGRIYREKWIEQAKLLAAGEETEFSARVKDGDVY